MYDIDYKTSNSSIIKPFQRIFFKNNSLNSQAATSTFPFKYNYTLANLISFVQKKKETFGFYSNNNSECNRLELRTLRILIHSVRLRIDRK